MRLLKCTGTDTFEFTQNYGLEDELPPYAILSHTWVANEEVTYDEVLEGRNKEKTGYEKIRRCGVQARLDHLDHFWVDTCCIDKSNKAELGLAIASMFRWYQNAARCYAYLSDVSVEDCAVSSEIYDATSATAFKRSSWFTRGWTLQELLAPTTVEFFSKDWRKLGDRKSLQRFITDATRIPSAALCNASLSNFGVEERFSWREYRKTTVEEDQAYCMMGIFGVSISPIYGEGVGIAFNRLRNQIHMLGECIQAIRITDPRDDKRRIEDTKGGLLAAPCRWVINSPQFQQWRNNPNNQLLWIKGDAGKGKTMLMCAAIDELRLSSSTILSYFFCQSTDNRINSATAVLRGLIYLLLDQDPYLAKHVRKKIETAGQSVFEDANAWYAMSEMFINILKDYNRKPVYLVVDALDECTSELPKLLDLIIETSASSSRVKWLLASRNELHIEQKLRQVGAERIMSLEIRQNAEQVSNAVNAFIDKKLSTIESLQDEELRSRVRGILSSKADGTFLWVALVVQELEKPESWDPLELVEEVPSGLDQLYDRMMEKIRRLHKKHSQTCRTLLTIALNAYRPLSLTELGGLSAVQTQNGATDETVGKLVAMCGSFLTIRYGQVYLVHQSAKDYLRDTSREIVLPPRYETHRHMFFRSVELMHETLRRDMYGLTQPGFPIEEIVTPINDPLAMVRYSCVFWVDHLQDSMIGEEVMEEQKLKAAEIIYGFLQHRYLYWLEALSLCKSVSTGILSMRKLETLSHV
ncbi:hypothetical protein N0V94_005988 [Neodidymelliopsis sp. IMI 364377]|nr:hypothetical protein N0V94_005988 [Neodidymelliopsis sp. IMI 364377]